MKYLVQILLRFVFVCLNFICFVVQSQNIEWQSAGEIPSHHSGGGRSFGVAALNGKIYLAGGYCGSHCELNVLDEYDPKNKLWASKSAMQSKRYKPTLVSHKGKLYAIGGYGPSLLKTAERFSPELNQWEYCASMLQDRYAFEAVSLNGKIYVMGGQTYGDLPLSSVEEYDSELNTWVLKTSMPIERVSFASIVNDEKIYVFGGRKNDDLINDVYSFDPIKNKWEYVTKIPRSRQTLAAVAFGGKIWLIGGNPSSTVNLMIDEYFPEKNEWRSIASNGLSRIECYSVIVDDFLYVFGGYDQFSIQKTRLPNYVAIIDNPKSLTLDLCSNQILSVSAANATSFQWYKDNALLLGETNSLININGAKPNIVGDYYAVAINSTSKATSSVAQVVVNAKMGITNGLVAYYPFSGNANDESGNNKNGIVNGPVLVADRFGKPLSAYRFQGTGGNIFVDQPTKFWANGSFTFSCWFSVQSGGLYQPRLICNGTLDVGLTDVSGSPNTFFAGWGFDGVFPDQKLVSGKYYHLVGSYDGNVANLYLNGEKIGSKTAKWILQTTSLPLSFGKNPHTGTDWFCGDLDDIRIYNRALSECEIKALNQFESPNQIVNRAPTLNALADVKLLQNAPSQTVNLSGIGSGAVDEVQVLTVTATSDNPGLIPHPAVTYTSPNAVGSLSYQLVAGVTGKATITVTVKDDGGVLNGGQDTFSRQFTVTVAPATPCSDLNLTNGLVAYYPFNGNARDESGSSEPPNAAEPSNHIFDGNLTFTDINGTLAFGSSWMEKPSWAVPDNELEFTFSFWFNQTNYPAAGVFSWNIDNSSGGRGFGPEGFRIYSLRDQINDAIAVNKIRFGVGNEWRINKLLPNQEWSWIETDLSDQQQGWHHIVAAYSAKGVQTLYVDGVLVGRMVGVKLSRIDNADGNNLYLSGRGGVQISEVRYYSKALTDCEVTALHELETKEQINRAPTLNALADVNLLQNAQSQTVSLSGISSGAVDEVQGLTVTANSDNPALIADPSVTYTSPNATGTLIYKSVAGVTGKATITVTVRDDGGVLNGGQDTFRRQFTVTVSPLNRAPTLNALAQVPQLSRVILRFCWDLSGSGGGFLHYIFDESRALRQT